MGEGPTGLGTVALVVCAAVAVAATSSAWAATGDDPASLQTVERDSVLMRVEVHDDGSARWRIEYRTRLDEENTTEAFESLQRDIEEDPGSYSRSFFDGINSSIATAENATGREMTGANYSVDAEIRHLPRRYGVVVYTFTWNGFAVVDGDRIEIGDALAGFFLGGNERLMIAWPAGYDFERVEPTPDERRDRAVIWNGPMEFGPNEPELVVERVTGPEWWNPWLAAALLAGLVVVGTGAWWLRRHRPVPNRGTGGEDPDLLSNEERVIQVLRDHGGRAKQQEIVDALDWTEAKTSRVISTLREQGRIDSFRLGRENVLALSDVEE
jgi:hypothetical protein